MSDEPIEVKIPKIPAIKIRSKEQEIKYYTATQFKLMWWRFRKHRLAVIGGSVLAIYLIIALFCEFIAPTTAVARDSDYLYGAPHNIHFIDQEGKFRGPFIYGLEITFNMETLLLETKEDTSKILPIRLLVKGEPYKLWGLIPGTVHLFGIEGKVIHLFGTDILGRDVFSRTLYGTRTSLSIGVVGVIISFFLGLGIGGVSGYFGGWIDNVVQRAIEFIRSIPTLPLWMSLAAIMPKEWSPLKVYFTITLLLAFVDWTNLARRVRSKLLSLREEDFVTAAVISGSNDARIISRHLLPAFLSYIIVDLTVSFPYMILGETSLSFIGLGLRPPVVSWGVLLQDAQNIKTIALHPWLFIPVVFVIVSVLAVSLVGDGLRDAADPYSQ